MQACTGSTIRQVLNVVYQKPDKGGVVISFGLALPAGPPFRGAYPTVNTLTDARSLIGLEMLPKIEGPNHKALLQYLSSY